MTIVEIFLEKMCSVFPSVSQGYETLLRLASRYGVCFAAQIRVDVKHFKTTDFDQVLGKLQSQSQSRIVVLFSGKSCATQLMAATKRVATKHAKPLIWVGCDGWSSRDVVTAGKPPWQQPVLMC